MTVAFTYKLIHDIWFYIAFFKVSLHNWFYIYLKIIIHSLMNSGYRIYYLQIIIIIKIIKYIIINVYMRFIVFEIEFNKGFLVSFIWIDRRIRRLEVSNNKIKIFVKPSILSFFFEDERREGKQQPRAERMGKLED